MIRWARVVLLAITRGCMMRVRSFVSVISVRLSAELLDQVDEAVANLGHTSEAIYPRGEWIRAAIRMRLAREAHPPQRIASKKNKVALRR